MNRPAGGSVAVGPARTLISVYTVMFTSMATTLVQVRIPDELVKELVRWIAEGRFSSRSEAVKTIVTLYKDRERTRMFYEMLSKRSEEARRHPERLVPLRDVF